MIFLFFLGRVGVGCRVVLAKLNSSSKTTLEAALAKNPPDLNSPALSQPNTVHGTPSPRHSTGSDVEYQDEIEVDDDKEHSEDDDEEKEGTLGKFFSACLDTLATLDPPKAGASTFERVAQHRFYG